MPTAPRPWVRHHQLLADRRLQSQQQYGQYRAAVRRRRRSLLIGGRGRRRNCDTHTTLVGGYGETVASLGPNCLSVCLLNIFLSPSVPCPPPLALSLSPLKNRSNDQLIWRALLCPVLVGSRRVCVCGLWLLITCELVAAELPAPPRVQDRYGLGWPDGY